MDTRSPSFLRVLWTDYTAFLAVLIPMVFWVFDGVMQLYARDMPTSNLYVNAALTVIGAAVLAWRWRAIAQIFDDGQEVTGQVVRLFFYQDRGRIEYQYTYLGQEYKSSNAVHRTKAVKALKEGSAVTVLVDRSNPKHALIRDLYVKG